MALTLEDSLVLARDAFPPETHEIVYCTVQRGSTGNRALVILVVQDFADTTHLTNYSLVVTREAGNTLTASTPQPFWVTNEPYTSFNLAYPNATLVEPGRVLFGYTYSFYDNGTYDRSVLFDLTMGPAGTVTVQQIEIVNSSWYQRIHVLSGGIAVLRYMVNNTAIQRADVYLTSTDAFQGSYTMPGNAWDPQEVMRRLPDGRATLRAYDKSFTFTVDETGIANQSALMNTAYAELILGTELIESWIAEKTDRTVFAMSQYNQFLYHADEPANNASGSFTSPLPATSRDLSAYGLQQSRLVYDEPDDLVWVIGSVGPVVASASPDDTDPTSSLALGATSDGAERWTLGMARCGPGLVTSHRIQGGPDLVLNLIMDTSVTDFPLDEEPEPVIYSALKESRRAFV